MKSAVVTGGAGFVGSHLVDFLLEKGMRVTAVDHLITGSLKNIAHCLDNPNFMWMQHDASQPFEIEGTIDYVLHLASPASPIDYVQIPIETLKAGSFATHHALELALRKNARFLLASTSEVYGDPEIHPQREDYWGNVNPIGVRSCYDEAKRYAEAVTMAYHRVHGVDTKIVRIFNTYGPRMRLDDGRVVPSFIGKALRGEALTLFGDGSQTRSFCYVSDLVEGLWRLINSDYHGPVNCGNPQEMTILEFAKAVSLYCQVPFHIEKKDLPADDPKVRKPDITLAQQLLDWQPTVPFEQGIQMTIDYFRDQLLQPCH
jgi:dTDP-glucose 4,6-dehydratase